MRIGAHMKTYRFFLVVALIAPSILLLTSSQGAFLSSGNRIALLPFFFASWLYMAAPQMFVVVLAFLVPRIRQAFALPALALLTILLVVFRLWIWWCVPAQEGAFAWVLYLPLSASALALLAIYLRVVARLSRVS